MPGLYRQKYWQFLGLVVLVLFGSDMVRELWKMFLSWVQKSKNCSEDLFMPTSCFTVLAISV